MMINSCYVDKTLFLDLETSKIVLWSLLILRPFTIYLFEEELTGMSGDVICDQVDIAVDSEISNFEPINSQIDAHEYNKGVIIKMGSALPNNVRSNGAFHQD